MKSKYFYPLLLIIVIPLIYWSSLSNGFVWLDTAEILNKKLIISDFSDWLGILFSEDNNFAGYHRPMYNLMHSFDYYLWGENAFGFHLSSLILHLINVLLIFNVLKTLSSNRHFAAAVALIFGLLPCHTATVALIHSKADLLTMLFVLLIANVMSKVDFKKETSMGWKSSLASVFLFILALLTKEVSIMLPVFAIGLFYLLRVKNIAPPKLSMLWPLLGTAVLFIIFRFSNKSVSANPDALDTIDRLLSFIPVYVNYIVLTLSGLELTTNDAIRLWNDMPFWQYGGYVLAFIGLIYAQFYLSKRHLLIAAGFLWYNLFLIPVAQIIPILHFRADRFLYIPSVGFVVAVVYSIFFIYEKKGWKNYKTVLLSVLSIYLLVASYKIVKRNKDFVSDEVMFSKLLEDHPECREAQGFLGNALLIKGQSAQAIKHINNALSTQEGYYSYTDSKSNLGNLGVIYMQQNKLEEALEIFTNLAAEQDVNPEVFFNLGLCTKKLNDFVTAKSHFEKYLEFKPNNLDALFNLGHIGLELGDRAMMQQYFGRYLEVNPNSEHRKLIEDLLKS